MHKRFWNFAWVVLVSLILLGCKTVEFGADAYAPIVPAPLAQAEPEDFEPVVVLRLVAAVDPGHSYQIEQAYVSRMRFGRQRAGSDTNALQNALGKTAYYTLELYRHLKSSMPDAKVLLQPATLTLSATGFPEVSTSYEIPYGALIVDFFAHYDPATTPATIFDVCTTYGNKLCPIVSISTAPALSPTTGGLLAVSERALGALKTRDSHGSLSGLGADIGIVLNNAAALSSDSPVWLDDKLTSERPLRRGKIFVFPDGPFFTGTVGRKVFTGEISKSDALYMFDATTEWTMRPYVNVVRDSLRNLWSDPAVSSLYTRYVAYFDSALAKNMAAGVSLTGRDRKKLRVINKFVATEYKVLAKRNDALVSALDSSGWTDKVQEALRHERKISGSILADQGMQMMGVAMAGMGAMGAATSDNVNTQFLSALAMAGGIGMTVSFGAGHGVIEDFGRFFSDAIDERTSYVVELVDGAEEIAARSVNELRMKMRQIYQRRYGPGA